MLLTLGVASGAYVLWVLFVIVFVRTLKEIDKSSWHYWLYANIRSYSPRDACDYGKALIVVPVFFAILWLIYVIVAILIALRILWHWAVCFLFTGRAPSSVLDKNYKLYFEELRPIPSIEWPIQTDWLMSPPPVFYAALVFILIDGMMYVSHIVSGQAAPWEIYLTLVILAATAAVLVLTVLIAGLIRPISVSAKAIHDHVKENWCPVLPIVDKSKTDPPNFAE